MPRAQPSDTSTPHAAIRHANKDELTRPSVASLVEPLSSDGITAEGAAVALTTQRACDQSERVRQPAHNAPNHAMAA